jgi:Kef-type K+ transport system membrane component KefB
VAVEIAEAIFPILVILALGIATAVVSRMVKVNPIVGYLFLGMVVSAVRPELLSAGGTVHLLAELGVVFLLFDIGLHFSTAHVRREAGDLFGFGPLQVGASTILISGCAWALGLSPVAALVVGTTLALSSSIDIAVPLPVRAAKDGRRQHRLFGLGQSRWAAELGTISQALQAVGAT